MIDLLIFIIILSATYVIGTTIIEKNHYADIKKRENKLLKLPAITAKNAINKNQKIKSCELVCGNVVVSIDYFKRFLGGLKNIFGGQIHSYEPILDRARREAILRMKESAPSADIIINMRIERSNVGGSSKDKNSIGCSEVLAYGTAIYFDKP